jgi:hypothetical protein
MSLHARPHAGSPNRLNSSGLPFIVMALPRLDRGIVRATCRGTCWNRCLDNPPIKSGRAMTGRVDCTFPVGENALGAPDLGHETVRLGGQLLHLPQQAGCPWPRANRSRVMPGLGPVATQGWARCPAWVSIRNETDQKPNARPKRADSYGRIQRAGAEFSRLARSPRRRGRRHPRPPCCYC